MSAKCIYCRKELATAESVHCYFSQDCRVRMLSREKRIVGVFWRIRAANGTIVASAYRTSRLKMRYAPKGSKRYRVTVRRKEKAK